MGELRIRYLVCKIGIFNIIAKNEECEKYTFPVVITDVNCIIVCQLLIICLLECISSRPNYTLKYYC